MSLFPAWRYNPSNGSRDKTLVNLQQEAYTPYVQKFVDPCSSSVGIRCHFKGSLLLGQKHDCEMGGSKCYMDPANAKCKVCNATSWEECDGNMTDCSSGMSCVSVNSKLTELVAGQGKQTTLRVASGCADVSLCNMDLFANFRHTQLSIQIGCARPGENVTANGKGRAGQPNGNKCFGCVAAPSECTKTVDCCDEETMCISAVETVAGKNLMVSRGCATESMCRYGQNISFGVLGKGLKGSVSCCKGNLCNSSAVLRDTLSAHFLVVLLMYFLLI